MRIKDPVLNVKFVQQHREIVIERAKCYAVILFILMLFDLTLIKIDTQAFAFMEIMKGLSLVSVIVCILLSTRHSAWIELLVIGTTVSRFVAVMLFFRRSKQDLENAQCKTLLFYLAETYMNIFQLIFEIIVFRAHQSVVVFTIIGTMIYSVIIASAYYPVCESSIQFKLAAMAFLSGPVVPLFFLTQLPTFDQLKLFVMKEKL